MRLIFSMSNKHAVSTGTLEIVESKAWEKDRGLMVVYCPNVNGKNYTRDLDVRFQSGGKNDEVDVIEKVYERVKKVCEKDTYEIYALAKEAIGEFRRSHEYCLMLEKRKIETGIKKS